MRKFILSLILMATIVFIANAVTYMRVYTTDGQITKYDVENVSQVSYIEGVTKNGEVGGYTYVDLGLPSGLKWATSNLGTSNEAMPGYYFAWGEIKQKQSYSWGSYKWCKGSDSTITKYCTDSKYGTVDNLTLLDSTDDAATMIWGEEWRMPTSSEIQELIDGCTWSYDVCFNGTIMSGAIGTSKTNGNTIFFPFGGSSKDSYRGPDNLYLNRHGAFWSKSQGNRFASIFYAERNIERVGTWSREEALNIRAVLQQNYTVKFYDVDGTLLDSQVVKNFEYATPPLLKGYNMCWSDSSFMSVTKNLNVYARKKKYIVNFYNRDSVLICSQELDSGKTASKVTVPDIVGYIFTGWSDSSFVRIKHNVNTYAQYKQGVSVSGQIGNYTYVDLGFDNCLMWATYNVGASASTEYGDYFACGETEPKESYTESNYKYYSNYKYTKYSARIDSLFSLLPEDDAATVNWGSEWRMPTYWELFDLVSACNWIWVDDYNGSGVAGKLGTSKYNGNTIFLPAGGVYTDKLYDVGETGYFWSSSFVERRSYGGEAYDLSVNKYCNTNEVYIYTGKNVRAVLKDYYAVYFYDDYGKLIERQCVKQNTSAIAPAINDSRFIGWNDSSFTNVTKNLKIYAKYIRPIYTVNFYTRDSILIESQQVDSAKSASNVKAPGLVGYWFYGWSDSFVKVEQDMNVYAQYNPLVDESGKVGDYTYVDLGLKSGLKWATYNVGANKSSEYGDYFAWGETSPKEMYTLDTYKWCYGSETSLTKYCLNSDYGTVDYLKTLEPEDDAATVNWGSEWRMPTKDELTELVNGCKWFTTDDYNGSGVAGKIGISKANGNAIFFPFTGYYGDNGLKEAGLFGYFYSSTVEYYSSNAYIFYTGSKSAYNFATGRFSGKTVRAVSDVK